jgi:drug/metabolite transporter (DMT)-like permease
MGHSLSVGDFLYMNNKKAYSFGLMAVLLWSTVATAFKIGLSDLEPSQLVLWSSSTSFVFLAIFSLIRKRGKQLFKQSRQEVFSSLLLGFINPFAYYLALFVAYDLLHAQEALSLNYTWAVALALLAIPMLKQKLPLKNLLALLVSFAGVIIIATKGEILSLNFSNPLGVSLALISAFLWALYWILNVKDKRNDEVKLTTNFLFGTIYILIFVLVEGDITIPTFKSLMAASYIGLFEMGVTFFLWLIALKNAKSTASIGSLVYLSPFISLVLISLILKETILTSTYVGLIFIISGILLSKCQKKQLLD